MSARADYDAPSSRPAPAPRVLARLVGWALACAAIEVAVAVAIVRWWQ